MTLNEGQHHSIWYQTVDCIGVCRRTYLARNQFISLRTQPKFNLFLIKIIKVWFSPLKICTCGMIYNLHELTHCMWQHTKFYPKPLKLQENTRVKDFLFSYGHDLTSRSRSFKLVSKVVKLCLSPYQNEQKSASKCLNVSQLKAVLVVGEFVLFCFVFAKSK